MSLIDMSYRVHHATIARLAWGCAPARAEHLMGPEDLINATLAVVALIVGLMWASIGWGIARLWRRRRSRRAILRRLKQ